ncbi:MAG: rhodanese-related sulfurtransferase [Alphaproteobacteria bacterium]|nr:rhodanese-related sulfurtransferase [Alphaproteobacteria bacterium]
MSKFVVAALYQFSSLSDVKELRSFLINLCNQQGIKGTLLLAKEGINGTVAGSRQAIDILESFLRSRFDALEYKESITNQMPFHRLKVRLKKEIVTLGVPEVNPCERVGTYVDPQDWNRLISDPDVLVLDTRNAYEVEIGTFRNAINPKTRTFTEFPEFVKHIDKKKHRRIAMFCTGGIRCEKASSYMISQGFEEVYHLKGGILKYLETTGPESSLWDGECFVFDGRVAVSHGLESGHYASCHGCRHPISQEDICSPFYERGVACPHCYHSLTSEKRKAARERQRQEDLAKLRGKKHIGAMMGET